MDIGLLWKNLRTLPDDHKLEIIKVEWVESHPWLLYSRSDDGAYCKACALFAPEEVNCQKLGVLVAHPFRIWTSQSSVFQHEKANYHQDSMAKMLHFKEVCANPSRNVASMLSKEREERLQHNTAVVKSLMECIIFCGRQGHSI